MNPIAMATIWRVSFASVFLAVLLVLQRAEAANEVTEILLENGLPKGLLPGTVKSYSISDDGKFQVKLSSACTTKIGTENVYYSKTITGSLSYQKIDNLSGIQAKEFFWVSVTSIEVDKDDPDYISFKVGIFSKSLSVDLFQVPPVCNSLDLENDTLDLERDAQLLTFSEWLATALKGTLRANIPYNKVPYAEARNIRKVLQ